MGTLELSKLFAFKVHKWKFSGQKFKWAIVMSKSIGMGSKVDF